MALNPIPFDLNRIFSTGGEALSSFKRVYDNSAPNLQRVSLGNPYFTPEVEHYYDIDPAAQYTIQQIGFHGGQGTYGSNPLRAYSETEAGVRTLLGTFGGAYNSQQSINGLSVTTRYLVFIFNTIDDGGWSVPAKIYLFGTTGNPSYVPPAVTSWQRFPLVNQFGVNDQWNYSYNSRSESVPVQNLTDRHKRFTGQRLYYGTNRLEENEGSYTVNTSTNQGTHLGPLLQRKKDNGQFRLLSVLGSTQYMINSFAAGYGYNEYIPIKSGANPALVASWAPLSRALKKAAEVLGTTGLNVLTHTMGGNEWDATWWGADTDHPNRDARLGYLNYKNYGPAVSMMYDGNNGQYPDCGVKNGDPNHTFVMPALANARPDPLFFTNLWWKRNRGGSMPSDIVYSFNAYDNTNNGGQFGTSVGINPEAGSFEQKVLQIHYLIQVIIGNPNVRIWNPELGYDLNPISFQRAGTTPTRNQEQTSADWTLRRLMLNAHLGIERSFIFDLRDYNAPGAGGNYGNSGVLNGDGSSRVIVNFIEQIKARFGNSTATRGATTPLTTYLLSDDYTANFVPSGAGDGTTGTINQTLTSAKSGIKIITLSDTSTNSTEVFQAKNSENKISYLVTQTPVFSQLQNVVVDPDPPGEIIPGLNPLERGLLALYA